MHRRLSAAAPEVEREVLDAPQLTAVKKYSRHASRITTNRKTASSHSTSFRVFIPKSDAYMRMITSTCWGIAFVLTVLLLQELGLIAPVVRRWGNDYLTVLHPIVWCRFCRLFSHVLHLTWRSTLCSSTSLWSISIWISKSSPCCPHVGVVACLSASFISSGIITAMYIGSEHTRRGRAVERGQEDPSTYRTIQSISFEFLLTLRFVG